MAEKFRMRLGDILVNENVITRQQLEKALSRQGGKRKKLGKVLIDMGITSEEEIAVAICIQLQLRFDPLKDVRPPLEVLNLLDNEFVTSNLVMPIKVQDGMLVMAVSDPFDNRMLDEAAKLSGMKVKPVVSTETKIIECIERNYKINDLIDEMLKAFDFDEDVRIHALPQDGEVDVERSFLVSESSPAMKLLAYILRDSIRLSASEIIIESLRNELRMRYRIEGDLVNIIGIHNSLKDTVVTHFKQVANLDVTRKNAPQTGRSSLVISGNTVELEVTTIPNIYGERINIKLFNKDKPVMSLGDLELPRTAESTLRGLVAPGQGLVLFCGPKGSGKSTLMYAILKDIGPDKKDIFAIEERVTSKLDGITQVELGEMTMVDEIKVVQRQKPDVIMVDEFADRETATQAMEAALRGCLVMSSVRAASPAQAVSRLLDMGVQPRLMASVLVGVVAQRLIRTNCPDCMERYEPDLSGLSGLGLPRANEYMRGKGCINCHNSGFKGRTLVTEIASIDPGIKRLIFDGAEEDLLARAFNARTGASIAMAAWEKVMNGVTSVEEAQNKVSIDLWGRPMGDRPVAPAATPPAQKKTQPPAPEPSAPVTSFDDIISPEELIAAGLSTDAGARSGQTEKPLETRAESAGMDKVILPEGFADVMRQHKVLLALAGLEEEKTYKKELRRNDFDVISTFHGDQALEIIYAENPDVMVCDMRLPSLNELISYKRLYDSSRRYLPVIAISKADTPTLSANEKKLKPDTILARPVTGETLVSNVNQLLSTLSPQKDWKVI